jgi:hypothetical protein
MSKRRKSQTRSEKTTPRAKPLVGKILKVLDGVDHLWAFLDGWEKVRDGTADQETEAAVLACVAEPAGELSFHAALTHVSEEIGELSVHADKARRAIKRSRLG